MSFKCPYTEVCRAEALIEFAAVPQLAALFSERLQCTERDSQRAHRCALVLGLTEKELPTLGKYVQEQRRASDLPQVQLAKQVGINIQVLRDLELNKVDPTRLPRGVLERIAEAISTPVDYLVSLAKLTSKAGLPRQGTVFARTVLLDDEAPESER